ncbi:MAG: hypothetical protein IJO20_05045 [Ruminococcus sp.]|nr:hypothetical protein [Ruminococcus sp.]
MREKLQNVFKETPERFGYTVDRALSQVRLTKKKRLSMPLRVVIAVVLIFAVLPSAVFGAVKGCGAIAQRVGLFGLSFNININEDAPKYVKMNVDIPDGFKEQENSAGLKFDRDDEEWTFGFTILPMRFYESVDYTVLEIDVKEYKATTIASRPAYELVGTDDYKGLSRYYVWYEEANVLILIYRGETVTDDELKAFVDSISFTQGTQSDHDTFFEPEKDQITDDTMTFVYEYVFVEMPVDKEIVFAGYNDQIGEGGLKVKSSISDIRVTDNINELDKSDLNTSFTSDELVDSNGKLLPKVVEIWQNGDGVNTETKLLSCESKEQKLVLVDIEFTNTTDKEVTIYIPHRLQTLAKDAFDNYIPATQIDKAQNISAKEYCDGEIFYMSDHGETDKDFYQPILKPNETKTITLGYRCIEEQLQNAYLVLNPSTDGVITPDYSGSANTYLIFKVQ